MFCKCNITDIHVLLIHSIKILLERLMCIRVKCWTSKEENLSPSLYSRGDFKNSKLDTYFIITVEYNDKNDDKAFVYL